MTGLQIIVDVLFFWLCVMPVKF